MTVMTEPTIMINGKTLTPAESMAVRVAITNVHAAMSHIDPLDTHGMAMARAYRDRLGDVLKLMFSDDYHPRRPAKRRGLGSREP